MLMSHDSTVPIRKGTFSSMSSKLFLLVLFSALVAPGLSAQASDAEMQRLAEQGGRAIAEGRLPEAEQAYTRLQQLAPNMAEVYGNLGLVYLLERKYPQAIQSLKAGMKLKPDLPRSDALLAICLSEEGHFTEARPGLEKAFRKSTGPDMKRMVGLQLERVYTGTQQDAKAVEVALELNRLYPKDPEILYHSGKLFGNYAFLTMKQLSDVAPDSSWWHQASAEVHESQGEYDISIDEYQKVLALDPQRPGIHFRIGRAMLLRAPQSQDPKKGTAEALNEFEQELRIDPTNANALYELGEQHRKDGDLEAAQKYLEAGVQYYPDFEQAQIALGRTLLALGKPGLALPHLQKAVTLNPDDEVTYYVLARVYLALGRSKDQQEAMARFQTLHAGRETRGTPGDVTKQEVDPAKEHE